MTFATVRDVPASWERYASLARSLARRAPAGLLLHVAGPTDEGFRMIDVWTSREDFERYRATTGADIDLAAPMILRELDAIATLDLRGDPLRPTESDAQR